MRRLLLLLGAVAAMALVPSTTAFAQAPPDRGQDACPPKFRDQPQPANPPDAVIEDPITCPIVRGALQAQVEVRAHGCGLTAPLYGTFAPGVAGEANAQEDILYVVDQDGPLWAINTKTGAKTLFIDVRRQKPMMPLGAFGPGTYDERGFLGVAFHPDYQKVGSPGFGKFYTYTSELPGTNADEKDHFNVVSEWQAADPLAPPPVHPCPDESAQPPPDEAAPDQAKFVREVLRAEWPQFNHNGGTIFFGTRPADRRVLYVTTGDGGCADDQNNQIGFRLVPCTGHGPGSEATAPNRAGNAQDPTAVWGKVLQVPEPEAVATPIVVTQDTRVVPPPATVKAFGLRNPWRASSDRFDLGGSGDLWISDVGQNHIEEVSHLPEDDLTRPTLCPTQGTTPTLSSNFGWHWKEGSFLFNPNLYVLLNPPSDGFVYAKAPCSDPDMIDPMAEYDHDEGTAVIGGFVYRGSDPDLRDLKGKYIFGDWSRRFLNGEGQVFFLDETDTLAEDPKAPHTPRVFWLTDGPLSNNSFVFGFGEDAKGNLYVIGNETGIPFKEFGYVGKLVRRCAPDSFLNGRPHAADCRD